MAEPVFDYDVFFSYRHKSLDAEITQKTFNAVESYRIPQALRRRGFRDVRRAFRDTEELPVSRVLTDTIDKALRSTNCLVVVCSTDTPSSEWIDREVATFIEIGRADHIYPLLISGAPERSFPPSLKLVPDIMDRVMDIRAGDGSVKKMMAREEMELLRVIAGVTGCRESELLREHKLRKNTQTASRAVAAAAVFAVIAAVSLGLMRLAEGYRETQERQKDASMRILNELTYSLPDHLTNVPGAYSRIADILRRNTVDIEAVLQLSSDQVDAAFEVAANYEKLANANAVLGKYEEALDAEQIAIDRLQALADQGTEGGELKLASAWNNRGSILNSSGRYTEAAQAFDKALDLLSGVSLEQPTKEKQLQFARTFINAGANAIDIGDDSRALSCFDQGLLSLSGLEKDEDPDSLQTFAETHFHYGTVLYRMGEYIAAEEHLRTACGFHRRLLKQVDSLQNRAKHVQYLNVLAAALTDQGDFDEADRTYIDALEISENLAEDGENTEYRRNLAVLCSNQAMMLNMRGDYGAADPLYVRAVGIYTQIIEKTDADADRTMAAMLNINCGENAYKLADDSRSRRYFEEGLALYESMLDRLGDFDRSQYEAWRSYYLLIHEKDYRASLEAALAAHELQPDNPLVNQILGYACLYSGYDEDADALLTAVASLGGGQAEMILRDLESQERGGLSSPHFAEIREIIAQVGK